MHATPVSPTERIRRACRRLAPHSKAVDILLASLSKARDNPDSERMRKVNVEQLNRVTDHAPGAADLLYACGYEPLFGHLVLQRYDRAKLDAAIASLAHVKRHSHEYHASAEAFERARAKALAEAAALEEAKARRSRFAALVPKEPNLREAEATSCTVVNVQNAAGERVASRRFDADHTLRDLLHYVRSLEPMPVDGSIKLQNVTQQTVDLDLEHCLDCSLYSLDLWPVSHVRVVSVGA